MAMTANRKYSKATTIQFDKRDPLWDETLGIGVEALIASIENEQELIEKLVAVSDFQKKLKKGLIEEPNLRSTNSIN
jgi:hypothetical protein